MIYNNINHYIMVKMLERERSPDIKWKVSEWEQSGGAGYRYVFEPI